MGALKDFNIIDLKAGGYHNVAMTDEFEFYIWGANNKYACMDGKTANVKTPMKFDVNEWAELDDEVIIAIWPGYHSSRVICSKTKSKPMLGVKIKTTMDEIKVD